VIPNVYEIHEYEHDRFQCVVARTNKYDEEKIREDTEKMNSMLCQEAKSQGIRYIFATAAISDTTRQRTKKDQKGVEGEQTIVFSNLAG
jgi:hypothetical protein